MNVYVAFLWRGALFFNPPPLPSSPVRWGSFFFASDAFFLLVPGARSPMLPLPLLHTPVSYIHMYVVFYGPCSSIDTRSSTAVSNRSSGRHAISLECVVYSVSGS